MECHRLHLICRYLAPERLDIRHILPDGAIEPQRETERRLLEQHAGRQLGLFDEAEAAALERAYDTGGLRAMPDRLAHRSAPRRPG